MSTTPAARSRWPTPSTPSTEREPVMVLAVLRQDNALYQFVYLLHIGAMVSAFAGVMVSARFQAAGRGDAATGRTVGSVLADLTTKMHVPALAAAGLFGILL